MPDQHQPAASLELSTLQALLDAGWTQLEVTKQGDPWTWIYGRLKGQRYSGASPYCPRCAAQMLVWERCPAPAASHQADPAPP